MPIFGPPNAAKAKARGNIKALVEMLSYKKDKNVRKEAAEALDALGWKPDKSAAGAFYWIEKCQWDKCVEIGASAVKPLIASLKDAEPDVRQAVVETLDALGWQPDRSEAGAIYWIEKGQCGKCVEIGTPAVQPLIAALKDKRWNVRKGAVEVLSQIGGTKIREPLIATLGDKSQRVRQAVTEALAKMKIKCGICRQELNFGRGGGLVIGSGAKGFEALLSMGARSTYRCRNCGTLICHSCARTNHCPKCGRNVFDRAIE